MNPKNLIFACALLSTSAVTASSLHSESCETAPTVSASASASDSFASQRAIDKAKVTTGVRGFVARMIDAKREKRAAGLMPLSEVHIPTPEEVGEIKDTYAPEIHGDHVTNMKRLSESRYDTSIEWAYHMRLTDGLAEIKDAGLLDNLKSILWQHREVARNLEIKIKDTMKLAAVDYDRIRRGKDRDFSFYQAKLDAIQKYATQLAEAYTNNAKIEAILDHAERIKNVYF